MKNKFLLKALDGMDGARACLDVGAGTEITETHFHDCAEIVYMIQGSMRVFIDGEWLQLNSGEALFVPPSVIHFTDCRQTDAKRAVIGFYDDLIAREDCDEYYRLLPYKSPKFNTGHTVLSANTPALANFSKRIAMLARNSSAYLLDLYVTVIEIYRAFFDMWEKSGENLCEVRKNPIAVKIEKYVRSNCRLSLSAPEVAAQMNVSYSYMARLLSESLGYGFSELLLRSRVDEAKMLLTSTEMTVTSVGFECGFSTTSAFIQSFKERTGKTPLAYRKSAVTK